MTDEINSSELKKWDVHFRGSDKVLCVEADMSPHQAIAQASFQADWLKMRDGGTINLAHVLAIVPHIDIDEPIPYLPTESAPALDTRPNLRDNDGDIWVPVAGTDAWQLTRDDDVPSHTRTYIEGVYGPVTEV